MENRTAGSIEKSRFTETRASVFLDLIRGLAALLVVYGHVRYLFFVDYPQLSGHRSLFALPYLVAACGHQAVMVFFVLSGYLVGGSVLRLLAKDTWSWGGYLTHRLVRLWIVLLPGITLCYLWDSIGLHAGVAPLLYHGDSGNHILADVTNRHSLGIAMENLFFLQTIRAPTFGSDGALWSLANEFWYYILFPLGILVVYPRRSLWTRVACGVAFVAVAWFCGPMIVASFPIWLLGVGLAMIRVPSFSARVRGLAAITYCVVFLVLAKFSRTADMRMDYLLAVITTVFLGFVLSARDGLRDSILEHVSRRISKFSYTLYVAHTPLAVLLTAFLVGDTRWQPTGLHLLIGVAVFAAVVSFAYGLAALTEFHTDPVRRRIESFLAALPGFARAPSLR